LLDFGSARRLIGDHTESITAILKPRYAPIEQYAETPQLRQGPWTDLYALAAVVVFLLDGVPPPASTARSIHDEMDALGTRQIPGVSAVFLRAMDWALAVRPQDRPQSVAAWRGALDGRLAAPPASRRRLMQPGHELVTVPRDSAADSFATTTRLARPAALEAHGRGSGTPQQGLFTRRWKLAAARILAGASMASLFLVLPLADTGTAARDSPTALTTAEVALPSPATDSLPPVFVVASAATISAPEAVSGAAALREPMHAPLRAAHSAAPRDAKAQKPSGKTNTRDRKRAALAKLPGPGPVELCANRFFLLRPFCVQSRCNEPQFRGHAQCARQPRQANRYARD
jgi:hypothetical protein